MGSIVVVADAGPLIALARADALKILPGLFGMVRITPDVTEEVITGSGRPGEAEIKAAIDAGWIEIQSAPTESTGPFRVSGLGPGEMSAISLAVAVEAALLVIDDRLGRIEARERGIEIIGTAAVVALAKANRLIPSARSLLSQIVANGYFISAPVIDVVCAKVGE